MFLDGATEHLGETGEGTFFHVNMMRRRTGISQFQWVSTYRFAVKKKFYLYVYYCQRIVLNKSLVLKLGAFII